MKNLFSIALLTLMVLTAVGCNPKKESVKRGVTARTSGLNGVVDGSYSGLNNCQQGESPIGTIFDQGQNQTSLYSAGTFEDRVKALLSATVKADEVGQISSAPNDQTGVRFQGVIKLDQNGNVVTTQSKMLIKVYDSFIFQYPDAKEIPIEFVNAAEGQINMQTGIGYILFRDQFGEVRFDGKIDAQFFSGTVSFKNYVSVTGGSPAQGQLGQFYVARCGIIQ